LNYNVGAGQTTSFNGTGHVDYDLGQLPPKDADDDWAFDRDDREDHADSANYVSREMTGYEDLDEYGEWSYVAGYGPCWHPRTVVAGWAPYRFGHWAYVGPWGWTWVDDASWGFAPFHYGRWVDIDNRWAWSPGRLLPPVPAGFGSDRPPAPDPLAPAAARSPAPLPGLGPPPRGHPQVPAVLEPRPRDLRHLPAHALLARVPDDPEPAGPQEQYYLEPLAGRCRELRRSRETDIGEAHSALKIVGGSVSIGMCCARSSVAAFCTHSRAS